MSDMDIKEIRTKLGLSQEQLAETIGLYKTGKKEQTLAKKRRA